MANLNLDVNYPDHPKTRRLKTMLGKESEYLPIKLWLYVGRLHPEGHLKDYNGQEIEAIVEWGGTPGAFIEAMERVEWLKKDEKNGYKLIGWKEHQGHLIAFKRRGKIAAKARWNKDKQRRATSMQQALLKSDSSNAPTNQTKPTVPNQPIQPPQGFPESENGARDSASFVGVPPDFAQKVWLETSARGWRDRQGQEIRNWRQYLKACHLRLVDYEARNGKTATRVPNLTSRRNNEADFMDPNPSSSPI
jgi:hypothetical protein